MFSPRNFPRRSHSHSNLGAIVHQATASATAFAVVEADTGRAFGRRLMQQHQSPSIVSSRRGVGMMNYSNRSSSVADLVRGIGAAAEVDAADSASQVNFQ